MNYLYKLSTMLAVVMPLAMAAEIKAGTIMLPVNGKTAPSNQIDWPPFHTTSANNYVSRPFINDIPCIGNNNKPGILCSDGFCDTSPPNKCNGHGGISPGHFVNKHPENVF